MSQQLLALVLCILIINATLAKSKSIQILMQLIIILNVQLNAVIYFVLFFCTQYAFSNVSSQRERRRRKRCIEIFKFDYFEIQFNSIKIVRILFKLNVHIKFMMLCYIGYHNLCT